MLNTYETYSQYNVDAFLLDDEFVAWIKQPNDKRNEYWELFLKQHPAQAETVRIAKKLLTAIDTDRETASDEVKSRIWKVVGEKAVAAPRVVFMQARKWWLAAAAVIIIASGVAIFQYTSKEKDYTASTGFGETRRIVLPDGSRVMLNANSSIEYGQTGKGQSPREVWLEGEAFFDVKHLHQEGTPVKESDRFIVHIKDMNVEVLGTSFNVSDRQSLTKILLQQGKVRVDFKDTQVKGITLQPGDLVEYDHATKQVVKTVAKTEQYTAWKNNKLVLNETSVQEIINMIEDNYGYKVEVENKELLTRTFSGSISAENENTIFRGLEIMLNASFIVKDKTLLIQNK